MMAEYANSIKRLTASVGNMTINISKIKEEIIVFLRNSDILTITQRGATTVTDTFSGNSSTTEFKINRTNAKNIRSITIGAATQTYGTDYEVDYTYDDSGTIKCKITFTTAPATGTDNISVQYDYGTDKIFPDYPREDLTISSYPRIAAELISISTREAGLGGKTTYSDAIIQIAILATDDTLETLVGTAREKLMDAKKSFYRFNFITPIATSQKIITERADEKIMTRVMDFELQRIMEIVS